MKKTAIILLLFITSTSIYAQQNKKILWELSVSADFGRYNNRVGIEF